MRCQKCGFVSFDYLTECKSCGVDLTATKDLLGFLSIKPSFPFFLESLLGSPKASAKPLPAGGGETVEAVDSGLADMDLGEDLAFDIDFSMMEEDENPVRAEASMVSPATETGSDLDFFKDLEKELSMDISDENLVGSLDTVDTSDGLELTIDFSLDEPSEAAADKPLGAAAAMRDKDSGHPEEVDDLLSLSMSEGDFDNLLLDEETKSSVQEKGSAGAGEAPAAAAHETQSLDGNVEIELGEEDLKDLLLEFEDTPPKKKK